jgi:hypothetical protein
MGEESAASRALTVTKAFAASATTAAIATDITFTATAKTDAADGKVLYIVDFGDGLAPASGSVKSGTALSAKHQYINGAWYNVTLTLSDADGNSSATTIGPIIITDSIGSGKLQARFDFTKPGKDYLKLGGTLRLPMGDAAGKAQVQFDIGGVLCGFTLDGKGTGVVTSNANVVSGSAQPATKCDGLFKLYIKKKPVKSEYASARFYLRLNNGSFLSAWLDENVFNRDADRESVKIATKILVSGFSGTTASTGNILYSSTLTQQFNARQGKGGSLR